MQEYKIRVFCWLILEWWLGCLEFFLIVSMKSAKREEVVDRTWVCSLSNRWWYMVMSKLRCTITFESRNFLISYAGFFVRQTFSLQVYVLRPTVDETFYLEHPLKGWRWSIIICKMYNIRGIVYGYVTLDFMMIRMLILEFW